jgi:peptidoglycan/xylan/chitin deacetylase (PgdA/CDA1 family)
MEKVGRRFDNGKLVITFDDVTDSEYLVAFPLLIAQGVQATFVIPTDQVGNSERMTWANLIEMNAAGMDIQCHSKTHTDFTTLTQAQILAELVAVNTAFVSNGLAAPHHLAYPGGAFNDNVVSYILASALRQTARGVNPYTIIYPYSDKLRIGAYGIDNISDANVIALKLIFDAVKYYKSGLILYCHGVSPGGGTYVVSTAHLNELIDYAQSIGIDIVTISSLYALMD